MGGTGALPASLNRPYGFAVAQNLHYPWVVIVGPDADAHQLVM